MSQGGIEPSPTLPQTRSEPVHLDGRLFNPVFDQEVRNLATLVTLKLDDLTHLLVVNKGAVAGKFLAIDQSPRVYEWDRLINCTFLNAFKSFLGSYSEIGLSDGLAGDKKLNRRFGSPCKVVKVFLPFLCWIRIWM